jgi:hypothetical protein
MMYKSLTNMAIYLTLHKYLLKRTVPVEDDPKKSSSFTRLISGINLP